MTELKPCPFCGGKASVVEKYKGWFVAKCNDCPCDVGRYWFPKRRQAIEAWNRRYEPVSEIDYDYEAEDD